MVSLHPPLHQHHGTDLPCSLPHTAPSWPPTAQRKLKQVMSCYFQILWWCWLHQTPHAMQFLSLHLPSFHDVATQKYHPRENMAAKTLSCPIPQCMYIHLYIDINICNCAEAPEYEKLLWVKPKSKSPLLPTSHHTTWRTHTSHCGWSIYTDIKRESRSLG